MVVWPLGRPFGGPDCPFWTQKRFLAQNQSFGGQPQKIVTIMTGHLKDKLFVLTALQGGLWEAVQVLFGPKIGPGH